MSQTGPSVLVVDDEEHIRSALGELLDVFGFDVVGMAGDGLQAVSMVERLRPEVVLMDLRMPEMDGLQAARSMLARWPGLGVVILTAYDDPALAQEAGSVGVFAFLTKGCAGQEIRRVLHGAAGRGRNEESGTISLQPVPSREG